MLKSILFLFSLLLLQFQFGFGLRCYQCNSKVDENCETLVDKSYLKECGEDGEMKDSANYVVCRKIDQWVDFEVLGQEAFKGVVRQCGTKSDDKACIYKAGFGGRVNICECKTPDCNGAATLTLLPATFLFALLAYFYSKSS